MEDQEIIELFFQRSEQAIVELSYQYGSMMRRVSFGILQDFEDAEECVNDAYLGVWNNIPPERPNPLAAYLCRITKNLSLNRLRYQQAKKRNLSMERSLEELEEIEGSLPAAGTPEEAWSEKELTKAIEKFLRGLDQKSRILFVKRYWFLISEEDLADEMDMRRNAVAVKLFRIRKKLKEYLRKEGVTI